MANAALLSDRVERFLARVDRNLFCLNEIERKALLNHLIDTWEWRYRNWIRTEGRSEFCADPADPIQASDFTLTITALYARRGGPSHLADCRCVICSFSPLYIAEAV
jgi:hypothetical protein